MRFHHSERVPVLSLLLICLVSPAPSRAELPATFQNLQVFPKDIKKADLVEEMKRFSFATGLRCEGCHAGKGGDSLEEMDWASDAKEEKRTARAMLKMVRAINSDWIGRLGHTTTVVVECATCHRGVRKPELLDRIVLATIREKGVQAAAGRWRELRRATYGKGVYDFGEKPLASIAQNLLAEGRAQDAAILLELNVESGTAGSWSYTLLSDARLAQGDRAGALAAARKAVEVEPKSEWARKKLAKLEADEGGEDHRP
jgi:photosynthetic reaction center cytochrome c subunit